MKNENQITPGRKQILLYLAQKNDWVFVADVFKDVEPERITTPEGTRKALKELEYVEMNNVGVPVHPTYRCRLKTTLDTLKKLTIMFDHNNMQPEFMQTQYYLDMIPQLCEHFETQLRKEDMPEMSEKARKYLSNMLPWSKSVLQFVLDETPDKIGETFKQIENKNTKKRPYIEKEIDKRLDDPDYMGDLVKVVTNLIKSCDVGTVEEQEMPPIDSDGLKKWYTQNQSDISNLFVTSWTPDIWMTMLSVLTKSDSILYYFDRDGISDLVWDV